MLLDAITAYDEVWAALQKVSVSTPKDAYRWIAIERLAAMRVKEVFYTLTAQVNSRSQAYLVHPRDPWLRRLARVPSVRGAPPASSARRPVGSYAQVAPPA